MLFLLFLTINEILVLGCWRCPATSPFYRTLCMNSQGLAFVLPSHKGKSEIYSAQYTNRSKIKGNSEKS